MCLFRVLTSVLPVQAVQLLEWAGRLPEWFVAFPEKTGQFREWGFPFPWSNTFISCRKLTKTINPIKILGQI